MARAAGASAKVGCVCGVTHPLLSADVGSLSATVEPVGQCLVSCVCSERHV